MSEIKAGDRVRIKPFEERAPRKPIGIATALYVCLSQTEHAWAQHLGEDDPVAHEIDCPCMYAEAIEITKAHIAALEAQEAA